MLYNIFFIEYTYNLIYNPPKKEDEFLFNLTASEFTGFASIILGIINIGVVLYIFNSNRKKLNQDREHDEKRNKNSFWYREVVLQPNIDFINQFFNDLKDIMQKLSDSNDDDYYLEQFIKFKELSSKLNDQFIELLKVIDEDLSGNIYLYVEELEDEFVEISMQFLEEQNKSDYLKSSTSILMEKRNLIFSELYSFEF